MKHRPRIRLSNALHMQVRPHCGFASKGSVTLLLTTPREPSQEMNLLHHAVYQGLESLQGRISH